MKRILTALIFLAFGCSSGSLLTIINNVGIDLLDTDNQNFLKMSGIEKDSGAINKMSFDKNNNTYLVIEKYTNNMFISTVYKCLAGQTAFKIIFKKEHFKINDLLIDKNNNVYLANDQEIYKCLAGQTAFKLIFKVANGMISSINIDTIKNNIFIVNTEDFEVIAVYKCLADETQFNKMSGIEEKLFFGASVIDSNGNIYISGDKGKVYKCLVDQTQFVQMTGIPDTGFISLKMLMTDSIGNVYVGIFGFIMYKCLADQTQFNSITGWTPEINIMCDYCLSACDNKGNLYEYSNIMNKNGKYEIYKCLADETQFKKWIELEYLPQQFIINKYNNMYLLSNKVIYKCLADETQFNKMTGIPNTINILKLIPNQENIYVTTMNEIYVSKDQNKL